MCVQYWYEEKSAERSKEEQHIKNTEFFNENAHKYRHKIENNTFIEICMGFWWFQMGINEF